MPIPFRTVRPPRSSVLVLAAALLGCGDSTTDPLPVPRSESNLPTRLLSDMIVSFPIGMDMGPRFNGHFYEARPILPGLLAACPFSTERARFECPPAALASFVLTRSFALADAAGSPRAAFDEATDRVSARRRLTGTTTFQLGGNIESGPRRTVVLTVDRSSDETVSGYASSDGRLRHDGVAEGTETELVVYARAPRDTLRVERQFADTVEGLVVTGYAGLGPSGPWPNLPALGRATRTMRVVTTRRGELPRTSDVRLVSEYLEGYVIRTTVTMDGAVLTCERPYDRLGMPYCT